MTLTRTTPGSCGAGQFDRYLDAGTNNAPQVARAVLKYPHGTDPQGGLTTDAGSTGQPTAALAYSAGFFNVADLTGLDANGLADPGFRLAEGAALTDAGAVVGIGV